MLAPAIILLCKSAHWQAALPQHQLP